MYMEFYSCQELHQNNINKSLSLEEVNKKATEMQSRVDSLDDDIKRMTSE